MSKKSNNKILQNKYHSLYFKQYKENVKKTKDILDILKKDNKEYYTFDDPDDDERFYYSKPDLLQKLKSLDIKNKELKKKIRIVNSLFYNSVKNIFPSIRNFKVQIKNLEKC